MKRLTRRSFAVCLGLVLGWIAAGMVFDSGEMTDDSGFLTPSSASAAASKDDGKKHDEHKDGEKHEDEGIKAAGKLAPKELPEQTPFFRSVLIGAVVLFIAAVPLGMFAMAMKGEDPPDPADDHHGHDDHGDGHH